MEYLLTMTTQVPEGTSEAAVQDIRTREAARSRELAAQGHLLRLWRPPLQPGEWRTLGLFAADDGAQLEEVLASMPLRVWRTDEVTPLSPHPNDPARQTDKPGLPAPEAGESEFLTTLSVTVPAGTLSQDVDATTARAGPVARPRHRRDASDPGGAAALRLDERADHAAHPTPQRSGAHQQLTTEHVMTEQDHKVAIITRGSQGTGQPQDQVPSTP
jgi:muconolactone D-isomerase